MPSLYPFQQEFLQKAVYLSTLGPLRHLLADDTGTGKTPQAIEVLKSINLTSGYALIVCTKSMVNKWVAQIRTWAGVQAFVIRGTPAQRQEQLQNIQPRRIFVIGYGTLLREQDFFIENPPEFIILDEAHKIKSHDAQITRAILKINAHHRLPLTATPQDKAPSELWAILHYLDPQRFPSYWQFAKKYDGYDYGAIHPKFTGPKNLPAFRFETGPYITRRTKDQVLKDLPPLREEVITLDWDPQQEKMYDDINLRDIVRIEQPQYWENWTNRASAYVNGDTKLVITTNIMAKLIRMKQIAVSPALVGGINVSPKIDFILDFLAGAVNPVCVYCEFEQGISLLETILIARGYSTVRITGKEGPRARDKAVNAVNNREVQVCLLTDAGGEGVDLYGADTIINLSQTYSRTKRKQVRDRIHRNGQVNPTTLYDLVMKDSIDERVLKLLQRKEEWVEQTLIQSLVEGLLEEAA